MKKIFLPLLALVGMVSCFTLSSCGGGGDSGNLAGRAYQFDRESTGVMEVTFMEKKKSNAQDAVYYTAEVAFLYDGKSVDSSCTVKLNDPNGAEEFAEEDIFENDVVLSFSGGDPVLAEENGFIAFMGGATLGDDAEGEDFANYTFSVKVKGGLPQKVSTIASGEIVAVTIEPKNEGDNEADAEAAATAEAVEKEAKTTGAVNVSRVR